MKQKRRTSTSIRKAHSTQTASNHRPKKERTKKQIAIALLKRSKGASLAEIQKAMGWQAHSVRGFLASNAKTVQGYKLISDKPDGMLRRYHLVPIEEVASS